MDIFGRSSTGAVFNTGIKEDVNALPLWEATEKVQEYISTNYSEALNGEKDESALIKTYIQKFLIDMKISVRDEKDAVNAIYNEMTSFSVLTKYLDESRSDVEEINVNAWNDIKVDFTDGRKESVDHFFSPRHAINVVRRLLAQSKITFDHSTPIVVGHLGKKIRITAIGYGVIDDDAGVSLSIRIVNPRKLTRDEFIANGTATAEMLDFLEACYTHGVSMCLTGATGSGKTTLMSYILGKVPYSKRLVTIESGCREFDCVVKDEQGNILNSVQHLITRPSDIVKQNITQTKLLEATLTIHPHFICVAEMKGEESFLAVSAANTGHAVVTTIHADSCAETYPRMVTLCKYGVSMDDRTLYSMTGKAFPVVVFARQLEDGVRRVTQITECTGFDKESGIPVLKTLWHFRTDDIIDSPGKDRVQVIGAYEKGGRPSEALLSRLFDNGMSKASIEKLRA